MNFSNITSKKTYILFFPGVFLSSIKNLGEVSVEQNDFPFEKFQGVSIDEIINDNALCDITESIPSYYAPNNWIECTELRCWSCSEKPRGTPFFIPVFLTNNQQLRTHGVFCNIACAGRYMQYSHDPEITSKWQSKQLMIMLYKEWYKEVLQDVPVADSPTLMSKFSGLRGISASEYLNKSNEKIKSLQI